ncbi:hypothetical protein, partial [Shewanella mangrovisoli]|uniref:hypothetical protein n=1 Tax=Shewanella mangrovisoli TaxID=2864211 RepID=UPI0035BB412E
HRQAPNFLVKRAESQLNKLAFLFFVLGHLAFLTVTSTVVFTLVQDLAALICLLLPIYLSLLQF